MKQNIKIKSEDGFLLDGEFVKVEDSKKGIIFAHGMTVDRDDEGVFVRSAPKLNKLGFSTIRFDFRAHGKSFGNSIKDFTISGELKDLEAVVKFMKEQGINWLGLAGASFGGSIASLYVLDHPKDIKALFLANPVLNYQKGFLNPTTLWAMKYFANAYEKLKKIGFIEIANRKFKVGKRLFDEMKLYDPCAALRSYKSPLLVVHGDRDSKVALKDTKECFGLLPNKQKRMEVIEGSEHGFHKEPYESQVVEMIVNFLVNIR